MKRSVRELIRQRELNTFTCVAPDTSIYQALSMLDLTRSSAVLVTQGEQLQGIFSEKDFAQASLKRGIQLTDKVQSIMTTRIYYVEPTFTLEECLQAMSKAHVRHLPVIENGKVLAFLSMRQIMEVLVEDKDAQIRELTNYITGSNTNYGFAQDKGIIKIPTYVSTQKQEAL